MRKNHVKTGTEDVWDFLGFSEEESAELKLRVMIYEKILVEEQPRISNLLSGKLEKFSSDKLFQYLEQIAPKKQFFLQEKRRKDPGRKVG